MAMTLSTSLTHPPPLQFLRLCTAITAITAITAFTAITAIIRLHVHFRRVASNSPKLRVLAFLNSAVSVLGDFCLDLVDEKINIYHKAKM